MFHSGADEYDENDFTPTSSSKLSALFGGPKNKSSNLKYVAPKQPRSDSGGANGEKANPAASGQQGQPQTSVVLMATAVHAYLYDYSSVNGTAQPQGRVMCCILGNVAERSFDLLLYRSKEDHLTRTKIHQHFTLSVLPNNYANFSDDRQRNWSIMLDTGQYADFVTQIGACRAISVLHGTSGQHLAQDVIGGDGPSLKEGDHAQISCSTWSITNGKKGEQLEELKSGQRIKLKEGSGTWESRLQGLQKNGRRLVFVPSSKDNTALIFHDVTLEKVKQKGGGDQSGRNTPQVDLQQQHKEISSSNRSLNMLPEDTESDASVPTSKATIVSRMARMGHALLPPGAVNARHPATDSESEVEEIGRRRKQKYISGSISGSVEELEATPAVRSRAASARSVNMKPEPAPRPTRLSSQPQQLVVYQSPWQQPALLPPGYTAVQSTVQQGGQPVIAAPQLSAPPDPTLSLLFSETRSQNTELKISVSKMSDKIDTLTSKIEKMEQQLQQGGNTTTASALVPSRMTMPQYNQSIHATNAFDPQAVLAQITTLVIDNEEMIGKLVDKDKKIVTLNESVTQLLQKNQKLLEEKTDMLMAKQQESGTTVSITEVLALREEKAGIHTQLETVQGQLTNLKEELSQSKESVEKQEEEINKFKTQLEEEKAKRLESENMLQTSKNKEIELSQSVKDLEAEKERLESILNQIKSQEQSFQGEVTDLSNKNKELQEMLKASESEVESLKGMLQSTLQQMEERTRGDGESSGEKEIEDQLREEIQSKNTRVIQLEQELMDLQSSISDIKQENSKQLDGYQTRLQKITSEKESLEKSYMQLKNLATNPEEVVGTVKKVMNNVFRTLKPQFTDAENYSGATIMQTLLTVIRDTTLQLLEDVEKKNKAGGGIVNSEIASNAQEDRGNGAIKVGIMQTSTNIESSKNVAVAEDDSCSNPPSLSSSCPAASSPSLSSSCTDTSSPSLNSSCTVESSPLLSSSGTVTSSGSPKIEEGLNHVDLNHDGAGEDHVEESNVESRMGESYDNERENEDNESKADISSSEGEYTDASERQFSSKSSLSSSSDSNSYECDKQINTISIGSASDNNVADDLSQDVMTDESKVIAPKIDEIHDSGTEQRTPVIDMENTGAKIIPYEKSDSSRDSSLDRAWRPQPPPPPLFSDEEDDDDWLS